MNEPESKPCKECEDRVYRWILKYQEGWNGPRAGWTQKNEDEYFRLAGILTLFARDFHFPQDDK
jgi:hypothetical protein